MRYEVLIMMAVVAAINVIGRIMAKRAQDRARAEESLQADAAAGASREPAAFRPTPALTVVPERRAKATVATAVAPASARVTTAKPPKPAPASVANPRAPLGTPAAMARAARAPVRRGIKPWTVVRAKDGFIASQVFGPPAALQGR